MPDVRRIALLAALASPPALAHTPAPVATGDQPWLVAALIAFAGAAYAAGLARLWPHSADRAALAWRAAAFFGGCGALAVLLLGPLDAAAPQSFALHMVQHEGLMLIAAPLLVLGRAMPLYLWALPHGLRLRTARGLQSPWLRRAWQVLTATLTAWLLHALALWLWHAPALFDAALRDPALHEWQHASFLASALLFWHALARRGSHGARALGLLYLFTTTIHTGVLGALLSLARRPWYTPVEPGLAAGFGLSPLEDQQLGGLIMWVPGALAYIGAALWLLARWVGPERARACSADH